MPELGKTPRFSSVLAKLQQDELILPYFENAMLADNWPNKYSVEIDSSPYYGLTDPEGEVHETGPGDGMFHPSTHPLLGARLLWYMFHPEYAGKLLYERRTMSSMMTLAMGSALHAIVQQQMVMANILTPERVEVEYVNRDHNVRGRIDFITDHPKHGLIPVEMKTQNTYSYRKQNEIKPSWDAQLSIALTEIGHDFGVLFLVESGWPYNMREFRVRRNDALVSEIYTKYAYVLESVEFDKPPRHCCAEGSAQMKTCPARFQCHLSSEAPGSTGLGMPTVKGTS